MLNNRNDQYEGGEESEYHFSEEEGNYESGAESPKATETTVAKENILTRLSQSKRMLISLGVFIVLIFIVYKMVTPSATLPPSIAITPQVAASPPSLSQSTGAQNRAPQAVAQEMPQVTSSPLQQMPTPPPTNQTGMMQAAGGASAVAPSAEIGSSSMPQAVQTPASTVSSSVGMPAMIPVQSNVLPTYSSGTVQAQTTPSTPPVREVGTVDPTMFNQLQAEYVQKLNEFTVQNKALQDQIQTLTERVSNMENQMNQLVSALMRQNQANNSVPTPSTSSTADQPKIPYNVQAIIPGRAWLKSDSGETVTVAEGDTIKDLGRVTKINPYDGVVEVNTGSRMVSLSYGNAES